MEQPIGSEVPAPAPPEEAAPDYKLFSPDQVAVATFLGSPVAGGVLMWLNSRRLGTSGWLPLLLGLGASALNLVLALLVTLAGSGMALALVFANRQLAESLQGKAVRQHQARGGKLASGWVAAGIGLLGLMVVLSTSVVAVVLSETVMTRTLEVRPGEEIRYQLGVTKDQAEDLGSYLTRVGYFDGKNQATVCLRREDKTWVVGFVLKEGYWDKPDFVKIFQDSKDEISQKAFHGEPVQIELLDSELEAHKTL